MKINITKFFASLAIFILSFANAFPQNVFKDDFNYAPIDSIEGTGGWFRSGVNSVYNIKIVSPGLTYAGYAGSGIGNTAYISNHGEGDVVYHNFSSAITSGAVYVSFMIRLDSLSSTMSAGYCICLNPNTGGTNLNTRLYLKKVTGTTFNFGIYKSKTVSYNSTAYNTNTTYLAVMKYAFVNGADNDSAKLYLFSSGVPSTEPSSPLVYATDSIDFSGQGSIYLSNNYAQSGLNGCSIKIDGIRIGNSWAASVLSSVKLISNEVPSGFSLHQNYPNPFNPSTIIEYGIPEYGFVKLKVYDVLGNEIKTLVSENLQAGKYEVDFSGENLPSGIYYYRLEANGFSVSKNMILVK